MTTNEAQNERNRVAEVLYEMADEITTKGGIKYARVAVQYGRDDDGANRLWIIVAEQIAQKLRDRADRESAA